MGVVAIPVDEEIYICKIVTRTSTDSGQVVSLEWVCGRSYGWGPFKKFLPR
jgi:hypothetical protein